MHEARISSVDRSRDNRLEVADVLQDDEHTLALYHFDEGQGTVLTDSSGNGHHGTIEGAVWVRSAQISPPPPAIVVASTAQPGNWYDLMPTLNTQDAAAYVRKEKESLIIDVTGPAANIPAEVAIAAQDYDLQLDVQAVTNTAGCNLLLPHASGQVRLNVGYGALCSLEGDEENDVPLTLVKGERRRIIVLVRQSKQPHELSVQVDGTALYSWQGQLANLDAKTLLDPHERPALNVNAKTALQLIAFKLLIHDGEAHFGPNKQVAPATERQAAVAERLRVPAEFFNGLAAGEVRHGLAGNRIRPGRPARSEARGGDPRGILSGHIRSDACPVPGSRRQIAPAGLAGGPGPAAHHVRLLGRCRRLLPAALGVACREGGRPPLPLADQRGVGIRLPGGYADHVLSRRQRDVRGRLRADQFQLAKPCAAGGGQAAQRLGPG
jgi:hypothetical protein